MRILAGLVMVAAVLGPGVSAAGTAAGASTLPACVTRPVPRFGPDTAFDMATIAEVPDPDATRCQGELRVMVVGDSIARGVANGLAAVGDPTVKVWDRSKLGCSFNASDYGRVCPRWRQLWAAAVAEVRPDVVVLYSTTHTELQDVGSAGSAYTTAGAEARRAREMSDAVAVLAGTGARVVLATVPVPRRPNGLFYCSGMELRSRCDPAWVASWNRSQALAGGATGAPVVGFAQWLAGRGDRFTDRPDGLHLSGTALVDHGRWLVPQLRMVAAGPPVRPAPVAVPVPQRTVCSTVRRKVPVRSASGKVLRWRTASVRSCQVVK